MQRFLWVAVGALGAVLAAACGSASKPPPGTALAGVASAVAASTQAPPAGDPTYQVVGSPAPTMTPTPFPPEQRTALAQGPNVPLDPYRDPGGKYVISLPRGWTLITQEKGNAFATFLAGDPYWGARISMSCSPGGATIDALMRFDRYVYTTTGAGTLPIDQARPLKVAGQDGSEVAWQGTLEGVQSSYWFDYFLAGGCAWRLNLTVVAPASTADLLSVFQRVRDSLRIL